MADEKEKEEGAEEAKGKGGGKSKKLIIIIAAVAVILLGAGGFFVLNGKASPDGGGGGEHAAEDSGHGGGHGKSSKGGHGGGHGDDEGAGSSYVALDPFIVNLQDNSGTRYLKVTVNLELASGSSSELESHKAKIRDSLIILLSSKSYSDIGTVEGKYRMRDEIVTRVNQYLKTSKVETAYFTEFVIQ